MKECDSRVQEGGEGLVLPLHPSAAATSIPERENYSREVTGSFDEPISHPSPPARKHLESFSMTFPPAQLVDSLLGITVSILHCLWLFWSLTGFLLGIKSKAGVIPCLTLTLSSISSLSSSFSSSVCALIPSYLLVLFRTEGGRLSPPPSEHGHAPAHAEHQWTGDTLSTPGEQLQPVNRFLSSLLLVRSRGEQVSDATSSPGTPVGNQLPPEDTMDVLISYICTNSLLCMNTQGKETGSFGV